MCAWTSSCFEIDLANLIFESLSNESSKWEATRHFKEREIPEQRISFVLIVADSIWSWDLEKESTAKRWQYDSNYLLLPLLTRSRSRNHSNSLYLLSLNCKANTKKFILAAACLLALGANISAQNPEKKEPVKKECSKNDAKSCDKKDAKTCDKKDGKACDQKADKSAQEAG